MYESVRGVDNGKHLGLIRSHKHPGGSIDVLALSKQGNQPRTRNASTDVYVTKSVKRPLKRAQWFRRVRGRVHVHSGV